MVPGSSSSPPVSPRRHHRPVLFLAATWVLLICGGLLSWRSSVFGKVIHVPPPKGVFGLTQGLPGELPQDLSLHVWQYWWVHRTLAAGEWPFVTDMKTWPAELNLLTVWGGHLDLLLGTWAVPVLGPAGASNLVIAILLLVTGLGAYALCHAITRSPLAATVGGILYMTSPPILGEALNGRAEEVTGGVVALAILYLGLWLVRGRRLHLVLAMVTMALSVLGYLANAIFLLFLLPLLALGFLPALLWREDPTPPARIILGRLAVLGGLALLASSPILWHAATNIGEQWSKGGGGEAAGTTYMDWLILSAAWRVGLEWMFSPFPLGRPGGTGLVLLLGAALSLVATRPARALPWWLGALGLHYLSLGPYFKTPTPGEPLLELPYRYLPEVLPFFMRFHWPLRFLLLGALCMAVLSAIGVARLQPGLKNPALPKVVAAVLCALSLLQVAQVVPLPILPIAPLPEPYRVLAEEPPGAILDVGIHGDIYTHVTDPHMAQIQHLRPKCCLSLPQSLNPRKVEELHERHFQFSFLQNLTPQTSSHLRGEPGLLEQLKRQPLSEIGFSHVILHLPITPGFEEPCPETGEGDGGSDGATRPAVMDLPGFVRELYGAPAAVSREETGCLYLFRTSGAPTPSGAPGARVPASARPGPAPSGLRRPDITR